MTNLDEEDDDIIGSRDEQITCDYTAILLGFAALIYAERDKGFLFQLNREILSQDIRIIELLKSRTDLAQATSSFYDKRSVEYQQALKIKMLFGFLKPDQLIKQANENALKDTKDFLNLVALSSDPEFQNLMRRRDRIAQVLLDELTHLIERGETIVIHPEKIKDVISWIKNTRKFLR